MTIRKTVKKVVQNNTKILQQKVIGMCSFNFKFGNSKSFFLKSKFFQRMFCILLAARFMLVVTTYVLREFDFILQVFSIRRGSICCVACQVWLPISQMKPKLDACKGKHQMNTWNRIVINFSNNARLSRCTVWFHLLFQLLCAAIYFMINLVKFFAVTIPTL